MISEDNRWQKTLLPFMQLVIVLLTIFYLIASIWQFNQFNNKVENSPRIDLKQFLGSYTLDSIQKYSLSIDRQNLVAQYYLEAYTVQARQANAEALLISRTWIKYLGFVTGMILCIVGAVFILGKLRDENQTLVGGEYVQGKLTLQSHSPGIILSILGTVLIVCTIFTHQPIEKFDSSVYFHPDNSLKHNSIDNLVKNLADSLGFSAPDTNIKPPSGF